MSKILCGDEAECLRTLPRESANMCVTSPPYYGLRDYGEQNQIGTEQTPEEYIARLVEVFDEVYRVLAKDGTMWLNLGDGYAGSGKDKGLSREKNEKDRPLYDGNSTVHIMPKSWSGIKPKDLTGIPWMAAFALRERGWYLRSDIIWYKTNCLSESVKDRPVKAYEHIFLFAKQQKYYFDYKAIQDPLKEVSKARYKRGRSDNSKYTRKTLQGINRQHEDFSMFDQEYRRKRDIWEVSTNSYRMDEHFAMFPERLIEPCVLAGSKVCGVVLDPFFGSGTTGAVAKRFGREYIGIDLNARYLEKAKQRIDNVSPEIA